MLIYTSVALNLYVRMLYLIYKRRGDYDGLPDVSPKVIETPAGTPVQVQRTSSKDSAVKAWMEMIARIPCYYY